MPTPYSRRLTLIIASVAGCQWSPGGDDTDGGADSDADTDADADTDLDVRDLPGGEALGECLVAPEDTSLQLNDVQVVVASCVLRVPDGTACPAADEPLEDWTGRPSGGCGAIGRTLCVTAALGQEDARDTGSFDSDVDTDPPPAIDRCLYECVIVLDGSECGRPLVDDQGEPAVAPPAPRDDWCDAVDLAGLPEDVRAALTHRWLTDAAAEHASIASFAQLTLDLLAHGAPADLVARATAAMHDEVRHARTAYGIASALLGQPVGPGPLAVPRRPPSSLARLAAEAVRDGCMNESLAAAEAAARLAGTRVPALRRALARIVADEARHAALARDVVTWASSIGGAEVARAVAAVWSQAVTAATVEVDELCAPDVGLCGGRVLAAVRARVRDEVWAPEARL